ncbi:unnamed protein product [Peniophora sp. CBMAI 1063]|nr:unnamed protein product [Peniophora sp. CBMAI 1063]
MEKLRLPSATSIVIPGSNVNGVAESKSACQALVHALTSQLARSSRTTLRIAADPIGDLVVQVHAPGKPIPVYSPQSVDTQAVDGVVIGIDATTLDNMLYPLSTRISGNITTVVLKALKGPWSEEMTLAFQTFDAVTELHVWGRARDVLTALAPRGSDGDLKVPFPRLKSLAISAGDQPDLCDGERWYGVRVDETAACHHDAAGAGWLAGLVPIIEARAAGGAPVHRLVMMGPVDCKGRVNTTRNETCALVGADVLEALQSSVHKFLDERTQ